MKIDLSAQEVNILTQALARAQVSGPPEAHMLVAELQIKLANLKPKEEPESEKQ